MSSSNKKMQSTTPQANGLASMSNIKGSRRKSLEINEEWIGAIDLDD